MNNSPMRMHVKNGKLVEIDLLYAGYNIQVCFGDAIFVYRQADFPNGMPDDFDDERIEMYDLSDGMPYYRDMQNKEIVQLLDKITGIPADTTELQDNLMKSIAELLTDPDAAYYCNLSNAERVWWLQQLDNLPADTTAVCDKLLSELAEEPDEE